MWFSFWFHPGWECAVFDFLRGTVPKDGFNFRVLRNWRVLLQRQWIVFFWVIFPLIYSFHGTLLSIRSWEPSPPHFWIGGWGSKCCWWFSWGISFTGRHLHFVRLTAYNNEIIIYWRVYNITMNPQDKLLKAIKKSDTGLLTDLLED